MPSPNTQERERDRAKEALTSRIFSRCYGANNMGQKHEQKQTTGNRIYIKVYFLKKIFQT